MSAYQFFWVVLCWVLAPVAVIASPQPTPQQSAGIIAPRPDSMQPMPPAASATVQNFYQTLLKTMQDGPQLGFTGRVDQLTPAMAQAFNFAEMTRIAVGPNWQKLSSAEQAEIIRLFSHFSIGTYASRFKKFGGEQFTVTGERDLPNGNKIVETVLLPKADQPVTLNYLMRQNAQGQWQINDVYLNATISELATRRAEFSQIVRTSGAAGLIQRLSDKISTLPAS